MVRLPFPPASSATRPHSRLLSGMLAALALLMLSGCYLPDRFQLDMNIDGAGNYAFIYRGDLVALNFLRKIGAGEVDGDDPDEIAAYVSDLERDSGFTAVDYIGQARYRVAYERQANIFEFGSFNFVRRTGPFITIKRTPEGLIRLEGNRPNQRYRQELTAAGFQTRGTVRVWTTNRVLSHNATEVQAGNPALYIWVIDSMEQPRPEMTMAPTG